MTQPPNPTRRHLLRGATAVAATATGIATSISSATATGIGTSIAPGPGPGSALAPAPAPRDRGRTPTLWREFTKAPYTHPQIPYIGRAGARAGRRGRPETPRIPGPRPDPATDSAPAINRALAEAGRRGGGTVVLHPGTYRIDDVIRIAHDNVTLRGAGSARTTLLATKSLTELIGPYGSRYGGDKSSWSWAGGLIWLAPQARWASLTDAIRARDWPFEGWTGNRRDAWETLTTVRPAHRGSWSVTVPDASRLRKGDLVLLRLADDAEHTLLEHMAGDGPGARAYTWDDKTKLTSYVPYEWPVRIAAVDRVRRRVTFERPLPLDVRPEWDPRLTTHVTALTGAGVAGLTLEAVETPQARTSWTRDTTA